MEKEMIFHNVTKVNSTIFVEKDSVKVEQYIGHSGHKLRALLAIAALLLAMVASISFQYGKRNRVLLEEHDDAEEVAPLYYGGRALPNDENA
jgi:hypothetical protein